MRSEMGRGDSRGARTSAAGVGGGAGRVREDDPCGSARVRERPARRERRSVGDGRDSRHGRGLGNGERDAGVEEKLRAEVDGAVARVVDLEVVGALWEGGCWGPDERAAGDSSSGAVSGVHGMAVVEDLLAMVATRSWFSGGPFLRSRFARPTSPDQVTVKGTPAVMPL